MGCGNTKTAPVDETAHKKDPTLVSDNNNGKSPQKSKPIEKASPLLLPPKPIAFEVNFNDENPFKRPPPPRLSRLAPLDNAPKLTHKQLVEKLEQAEVARSKELERKRTLSRKSSRRRLDILQAKEFDKENQLADVDFDLRVKEEKRQQALEAKREKARRQEERRKRVRAKARRMSEAPEEEVANLDLERDMTFNRGDENRDEVDSWLGETDDSKLVANKLREIPRDDSGNYSNASGPRGGFGDGLPADPKDGLLGNTLPSNELPSKGIPSNGFPGNSFPSIRERGSSAQTIESLHVSNTRGERVKMLPDDEDFFDS